MIVTPPEVAAFNCMRLARSNPCRGVQSTLAAADKVAIGEEMETKTEYERDSGRPNINSPDFKEKDEKLCQQLAASVFVVPKRLAGLLISPNKSPAPRLERKMVTLAAPETGKFPRRTLLIQPRSTVKAAETVPEMIGSLVPTETTALAMWIGAWS